MTFLTFSPPLFACRSAVHFVKSKSKFWLRCVCTVSSVDSWLTGVCCFGVWRFAAFWQDGAMQAREGVYKGFERKLVGHNLHLIE